MRLRFVTGRDRRRVPSMLVVAVGAVLVGSLLPAPTGAESTTVAAVSPLDLGFDLELLGVEVGVDKWVHAGSYAVVAGVAAASRDWRRLGLALAAIVVAVAVLGVGVEFAQSVVPGRTTSAADAVANAVGAAVGVAGWWAFVRRRSDLDSDPSLSS